MRERNVKPCTFYGSYSEELTAYLDDLIDQGYFRKDDDGKARKKYRT